MAAVEFTVRFLQSLKATGASYDLYDKKVTGFGFRVTPNGKKTFFNTVGQPIRATRSMTYHQSAVSLPLWLYFGDAKTQPKGKSSQPTLKKTIKLDKLPGTLRLLSEDHQILHKDFNFKANNIINTAQGVSESAKTVAIDRARSFHYLAPDARTAAGLSKTLTLGACRSARSLWNLG